MTLYEKVIEYIKNNKCPLKKPGLTTYKSDMKNNNLHVKCNEFNKCNYQMKFKNDSCKKVI